MAAVPPHLFLSTLPVRGATAEGLIIIDRVRRISIHAPREGSDPRIERQTELYWGISIHAPREGSDPP